jgi:hypothetical protein
MIARHWHGRVPAALAADYLRLMAETALPDYRAVPGNISALCLHRREGGIVHVGMLTLWEDEAAIRRFAGEDMGRALYYEFDADYLLELETSVRHYEVIAGDD